MKVWRLRTRAIALDQPVVMGVLNVTPDSFSDGGAFVDPDTALRHALDLVDAGAAIVDVGGESTRPGAHPVDVSEEMTRVVPIVQRLAAEGVTVSVDTMKAEVAEAAIDAGAEIVNDVGGFGDPAMRRVAADSGVGIVVMHMQGEPRTMQIQPSYDDVVADVAAFLVDRVGLCVAAGVDPSSVCVDPGIGFGKTTQHNLELFDGLPDLVALGFPVMVGASRKRFIGEILGIEEPERRDAATSVLTAMAVERGARLFRVHDPRSSVEAATLAWAIVGGHAPSRPSGSQ